MSRQVLLVEWEDATGRLGWQDESEAAGASVMLCTSVGILVSRNESRVVLALTACDAEEMVSNTLVVPTRFIRKTKRLATLKGKP